MLESESTKTFGFLWWVTRLCDKGGHLEFESSVFQFISQSKLGFLIPFSFPIFSGSLSLVSFAALEGCHVKGSLSSKTHHRRRLALVEDSPSSKTCRRRRLAADESFAALCHRGTVEGSPSIVEGSENTSCWKEKQICNPTMFWYGCSYFSNREWWRSIGAKGFVSLTIAARFSGSGIQGCVLGGEEDIITLSTVRSNGSGKVGSGKQLCMEELDLDAKERDYFHNADEDNKLDEAIEDTILELELDESQSQFKKSL
ncbi:hypothetical protein V8G54_035564 [Vigna mungo]|uniref:Uncharacterized protein n=1 Tax=Vigna mungo TaxID=3915 RepID=A0AAQ3MFN8_VIGMU